MHLHFISSPGILNYLNILEFGSCLGLVTYLVRGKAQEWEGFAIELPRARAIKEWLILIFFLIFSIK